MTIKTSSYRQSLLAALLDPVEASAYLNAALEDSPEAFLKALKNVAQARPMAKVAKDAGIQRETLYRSFSEQGNPTFETLSSVLGALGMKLSIILDNSGSHQATTASRMKPISVEKIERVHGSGNAFRRLRLSQPRHRAVEGHPCRGDHQNSQPERVDSPYRPRANRHRRSRLLPHPERRPRPLQPSTGSLRSSTGLALASRFVLERPRRISSTIPHLSDQAKPTYFGGSPIHVEF